MKELRFEAADGERRAAFAFDPETKGAMVKDHVDRGYFSARFAFMVFPDGSALPLSPKPPSSIGGAASACCLLKVRASDRPVLLKRRAI